jgi:hypothetical protein
MKVWDPKEARISGTRRLLAKLVYQEPLQPVDRLVYQGHFPC